VEQQNFAATATRHEYSDLCTCAHRHTVGVAGVVYESIRSELRLHAAARSADRRSEVINTRVWGGIHFRTADEQGAKLGRTVASRISMIRVAFSSTTLWATKVP